MSLLSTIRDALGLTPPFKVGPPAPFEVRPRAKWHLDQHPERTLALRRRGGSLELAPVEEPDGGLMIEASLRDELAGVYLDHDGQDFVLGAVLDLRPATTPNPEVRLYEATRPLASGRPLHTDTPDEAPGLAGAVMAVPGVASLLVRDNTISIERTAGTSWRSLDAQVVEALRTWFARGGGILTSLDAGRGDDPEWEAVSAVMREQVLPFVHSHGGDIELIDVSHGVVTVRLHGACATCPASMLTLKGGVQRQLRELLPDIVDRVESLDANG